MLSPEEVLWGYRFILDRDPESETVVQEHRARADWRELRRTLLDSGEYSAVTKSLSATGKWVMCEVFSGRSVMWVNLADKFVSFGCLIDNYEPAETAVFSRLIEPGFNIADVGANIGWFTLLAAQKLRDGGGGHVFAFEPQRPIVGYLRRTVQANGHDALVTVIDAALGAEQGQGALIDQPRSPNPGGAHLTAPGGGAPSQPVRIDTLDAHFAETRLDLIKMDIEGAEPLAMRGGLDTLRRDRPVILCEINPPLMQAVSGVAARDFRRMLEDELGYRMQVIGPEYDLRPAPADLDFDAQGLTNVVFSPAP